MEWTGYWAFFCNPMKYRIDTKLSQEDQFETWQISNGQEGMFRIGDKGVIRVSVDKRPDIDKPLDPGVYAICEVIGLPHLRESNEPLWTERPQDYHDRKVVDIKVTKNLLSRPIHIQTLKDHPLFDDDLFLYSGYGWYSAFPITKVTFDVITSLI